MTGQLQPVSTWCLSQFESSLETMLSLHSYVNFLQGLKGADGELLQVSRRHIFELN